MIKNLQEKLQQGYLNNERVQKCEKCSKSFYKIFETQNIQNQTNLEHSSNPKDIFKSAKKNYKNSKDDSLKLPYLGLSKILNRKKNFKETIQLLLGYDFFKSS